MANPYEPTLRHDCNDTSPVWLLNALVITADDLFRSRTLSADEARVLLRAQGFVEHQSGRIALQSAIHGDVLIPLVSGHQSGHAARDYAAATGAS